MNPQSAAQAYRQSSIENAPPIQLVRLLYEGALRYVDRAASLDPRTAHAEFAAWVGRADAIVTELSIALDREPAPEVAQGLAQLYEFVQHQLAEALLRRDKTPLAEARQVLATLLDGWRHVEVSTAGQPSR